MSTITVHHNARIHTLDPGRPRASSMLVRDGRIVAVGDEHLPHRCGAVDEVVDHGGAVLLPGLADAHNHHMQAGRAQMLELELHGSTDLDGILRAVRSWSADLPADGWVVGGGWGSALTATLSGADALAALDGAAGNRPVLLRDETFHRAWVSSTALTAAGITERSTDPVGGAVLRDGPTRRPVGVLVDAAITQVERAAAAATPAAPHEDVEACRRGIEILHSHGVTAFTDVAASVPMLRALHHLDLIGQLEAWVVTSQWPEGRITGPDAAEAEIGPGLTGRRELLGARFRFRSRHHRPDFLTLVVDGTGSGAAHPGTIAPGDLAECLRWAADQGLGVKITCAQNVSLPIVIEAVGRLRAVGQRDAIVHVAPGSESGFDPHHAPLFAALGVVVETTSRDGRRGPDGRGSDPDPAGTLLGMGVPIAAGSEWPMAPSPNPWPGICAMVTGTDPAVPVGQAIRTHSLDAVAAMGLVALTGSLEPGKSADFIVLDRDPFAVPVAEIAGTVTDSTWFAGRLVYRR